MSLHEQLRLFVLDRISSDEPRLTSISVSDAYIKRQVAAGRWVSVCDDQRSAEYLGVQQVVRSLLRVIVPENPEPESGQTELLPETKLLRERYSVKGEGGEEQYVERSDLTEDEMRQVVSRFRALSVRYERHAKALEAEWYKMHDLLTGVGPVSEGVDR